MSRSEILSQAWGLRTPPFAPETDSQGNPIHERATARTLEPKREPKVVSFYFDVYDWSRAHLFQGLSSESMFVRFPSLNELVDDKQTILVLISGSVQTGRRSLKNLILHKVCEASAGKEIIVETRLGDEDQDGIVKSLARGFIQDFVAAEPRAPEEPLWKIYEHLEKDPKAYVNVFDSMRKRVREYTLRPIVLIPEVLEYSDNWQLIYKATEGLATLIIVITSNHIQAGTCARSLKQEQVIHIKANMLNLDKTRDYIRKRVALLRLPNQAALNLDDIAPFSEASLRALYEEGSKPDKNRPIEFPISEINRTLVSAVNKHLDKLSQVVERGGIAALDRLGPDSLLIQPDLIFEVREQINRGN